MSRPQVEHRPFDMPSLYERVALPYLLDNSNQDHLEVVLAVWLPDWEPRYTRKMFEDFNAFTKRVIAPRDCRMTLTDPTLPGFFRVRHDRRSPEGTLLRHLYRDLQVIPWSTLDHLRTHVAKQAYRKPGAYHIAGGHEVYEMDDVLEATRSKLPGHRVQAELTIYTDFTLPANYLRAPAKETPCR